MDEKKHTFELSLAPIRTLIYSSLYNLNGIRDGWGIGMGVSSSDFSDQCYYVDLLNDLEKQLNEQGVDATEMIEKINQRILEDHRERKKSLRDRVMEYYFNKELEKYGLNGDEITQKVERRVREKLLERRNKFYHLTWEESFKETLMSHGIDKEKIEKIFLEANEKSREKLNEWEKRNYYDIKLNCLDEELKKYGIDGKEMVERAYKKVDAENLIDCEESSVTSL